NIAWIIWHDKLLSRFSTILPDSADTRQVLSINADMMFNVSLLFVTIVAFALGWMNIASTLGFND
ncbi:hypothetical protein ABMY39_14600, partial [Lacticaseibacillus paracasei]